MSDGMDPSKLRIDSGWLVYDVGQHTCGGYGAASGWAHEPGCGFEALVSVEELVRILDVHADAQLAERKAQAAADPDCEVTW